MIGNNQILNHEYLPMNYYYIFEKVKGSLFFLSYVNTK